jgi:DNA-binding response OmpR family regulator
MEEKKTVVIFENERAMQEVLRLFFAKKGFQTRIFPDGEKAAERVRDCAPALIMMDLMMPAAGGFEACADIRRVDAHTPIIILSAKLYAEDKQHALAMGANAFLVKPFSPSELSAAIESLASPKA